MSAALEAKTQRAIYARVLGGRHPDVQLGCWCKEAEA